MANKVRTTITMDAEVKSKIEKINEQTGANLSALANILLKNYVETHKVEN